jgi:hypothetical protein
MAEVQERYDHSQVWDALESLGVEGIALTTMYYEKGAYADGVREVLRQVANRFAQMEQRLQALEEWQR